MGGLGPARVGGGGEGGSEALFHAPGWEADEALAKGKLLFPLWKLLSLFSVRLVKTIVCCGVSIIKEEEIVCV